MVGALAEGVQDDLARPQFFAAPDGRGIETGREDDEDPIRPQRRRDDAGEIFLTAQKMQLAQLCSGQRGLEPARARHDKLDPRFVEARLVVARFGESVGASSRHSSAPFAAYAGLAPTPWQSGSIDREQGVSKAGNARLRTTLIQLAWLWLRHQPQSALSRWFHERVKRDGGRMKKTTIVALARKLLVALWKYVAAGVVVEGAVMKAA